MLIVRKTDAGTYVELASSDPLLEQIATTAEVRKLTLEDGEVIESYFTVETTTVLRHDWDWARAADADVLAALRYWRLNQVDAPPGKRQVGYTIEDQDGAPILVPEYEDLPDAPPPPAPTIPSISFRQFLLQARADGLIDDVEALAAAESRAMPAAIAAVIESLPADQQIAAKITWLTMTQLDRDTPLTALVSAALGKDDAATDDFFRAAARL